MMNAYDLSYSVAYQHISDLRREATARRLLPARPRPRTPHLLSRRLWLSNALTGTC